MARNSTIFFAKLFIKAFLGFFIFILLALIALPGILVFWVISEVVYILIRIKIGNNFVRPIGGDILLGLETERSRPIINTIGRYRGKIDVKKFVDRMKDLNQLLDDDGKMRFKRFRQVYEKIYGYQVFKETGNFDMYEHVEISNIRDFFPDKFNNSDKTGEEPQIEWESLVERVMEKHGTQPFVEGRPQWDILFIEENEFTTMFFRVHHSVCDGVYFLRFLMEHVGDEPVDCKLPYNYHPPNKIRRFLDLFMSFCMFPWGLLRMLQIRNMEKNPLHGPMLSGDKMFLSSKRLPVETLKEIKTESKMSINTIIFTCMSNAFASHFKKKNSNVENLIVLVPLSLHNLDNKIKLKNKFAVVLINVPTFINRRFSDEAQKNPMSALDRMHEVQASCDKTKEDLSTLALHNIYIFFCSILPTRLIFKFNKTNGFTSTMSNVVGPQGEDLILVTGVPQADSLFWIPDQSPLGMGVSICGFAGNIRVGLMVDRVLMETKEEGYSFIEAFIEEIHNLRRELLNRKKQSCSIRINGLPSNNQKGISQEYKDSDCVPHNEEEDYDVSYEKENISFPSLLPAKEIEYSSRT